MDHSPLKKKKKSINKCKCCNAALGTDFHLIFDEAGTKLNIAQLLFDSIGVRINVDDGGGQAICDGCLQQVIQTYNFKQKCLQTADDGDTSDEEKPNQDFDNDVELLEDEYLDDVHLNQDNIKVDEEMNIDLSNENVEYEDLEHSDVEYLTETLEEENTEDYVDDEYLDDSQLSNGEPIEHTDNIGHLQNESEYPNEQMYGDCEATTTSSQIQIEAQYPAHPIIFNKFDYELSKMKQKIKLGVPRHNIKTKIHTSESSNSLVVDKIMTSDDLINILEDDYRSETVHKQTRLDDNDEEFSKTEMGDTHTNIDDYLNSIVSAVYSEYDVFDKPLQCVLCHDKFTTHHGMIFHISQNHKIGNDFYQCIFNRDCSLLTGIEALGPHIFSNHFDLLPTRMWLTCQTCDNSFQSSIQFGKHMCLKLQTIERGEENFQCTVCDKKLASKKRFLFHKQFHLKNARPKCCIICEITFTDEDDFYNHIMFSHENVFEHFCEQCDKSYSTKLHLDRHLKMHATLQNECIPCEKTFENRTALEMHNAIKHAPSDQEKTLKCHLCDKVYARSSRLRKHMTTHETADPNLVISCDECLMVFLDEDKAAEHCQRVHDENTEIIKKISLTESYCCEFCENSYYDIPALIKHKKIHKSSVPYECDTCTSRYDSFSKLKTHKQSHQNGNAAFPIIRKYVCDIPECLKPYRHWGDLTMHRKTVHLINPSILKCSDCGKTFYQSWKLHYHCNTQHGSPVVCEICNKTLPTVISHRTHMRKHKRTADADQTVKPPVKKASNKKAKRKTTHDIEPYLKIENGQMSCTACGKQMVSRNNARSHIEIVHLKVRNYSCGECQKDFYLRKDLIDHMRLHTAEVPFKCSEPNCGKSFRTSSLFAEHRKSHNQNRPYKCTYCTASFKRSYVLKTHIKQHLGIKGFSCDFENCNKEYRTQWELNYHVKKKHVIEPINCAHENCDGTFKRTYDLTMHYRSEHKREPPKEPKKITPKRKSTAKTKAKKQSTNIPKVIYVLPGPVTERETQSKTGESDNECELNVEHNYQAKQAAIDIEASNNPKFVYYVTPANRSRALTQLKSAAEADKTIDNSASLESDTMSPDVQYTYTHKDDFDLIEDDAGDSDLNVEYLFED